MARLHQRYDLVLCPTVPAGPPLADAPTTDPVRGAVDAVGAVDLHLQPDPPAGDHRADGAAGERAAELGADRGGAVRDDLVLRAARAIELAQPFPVAPID